jgi:hypothetical protein
VLTFNDVAQPTTYVDPQTKIVNITSAACAVPGTTMVRARDTISGLSTNTIPFVVSPWDPLKIGPALRWWLDGSSLEDDGSGRAQAWNDKSGGGRHITQPTAGKRPLIVNASAAFNGKPTARFDNIRQDSFNTGQTWVTLGAAGLINKTAYNIWVVVNYTLLGTNQTALGETNGYIWVSGTNTTPERIACLDSAEFSASPIITYTFSTQQAFAVRARKDAANVYLRIARGAETAVAALDDQAVPRVRDEAQRDELAILVDRNLDGTSRAQLVERLGVRVGTQVLHRRSVVHAGARE